MLEEDSEKNELTDVRMPSSNRTILSMSVYLRKYASYSDAILLKVAIGYVIEL